MAAAVFGLALAVAGAALLWANAFPRGKLFDPVAALPDPLPADSAELHARRIAMAAGDAGAFWGRAVQAATGRAYRPPELVFFTRVTETACADGALSAGPFYCAATRTAAFDLNFAEMLSRRLRRNAELGNALVTARITAQPALETLRAPGAADAPPLAADCLTGVWAAARRERIGEVPPGHYGRLVEIARNTARDLERTGPGIFRGIDAFRTGRRADRDAAFQAGLGAELPADCLRPAPVVPGG